MKNLRLTTFVLLLLAGLTTSRANIVGPYTADANTLILLHFEDTVGTSTIANSGNLLPSHNFYSVNNAGAQVSPQPSFTPTNITTVLGGAAGFTGFGRSASFGGVTSVGNNTSATNVVIWDFNGNGSIQGDPGNTVAIGTGTAEGADAFPLNTLNIGNGGSSPWTIEAMINTPGIIAVNGGNANEGTILSTDSGGGSSGNRGFLFRITPAGALEFFVVTGTPGSQSIDCVEGIPTSGPDAFVPNQWFHVAVTYDGTTVRMYWTRVTATASSAHLLGQWGSPLSPVLYGTVVGGYTGVLSVGNDVRDSSSNVGFPGQIDEVRISSVCRSAGQMLFANGVTIASQPANQILAAGATATFTVAATTDYPNLSYQWLSNGVALANGGDVSGATTATLTIHNNQTAYSANYSCQISNGRTPTPDTATSSPAFLAVTPSGTPAVTWNGLANGNWDNSSVTNWYATGGTTATFFVAGDAATFDDTANLTGTGGSATAVVSLGATATANISSGGAATANVSTGGGATVLINNSATATAVLSGGGVGTVNLASGGANYPVNPTITFSGGGGTGATATAVVSGGVISAINVTAAGTGYTSAPTVVIGGNITGFSGLTGGSGYTSNPPVTITGGGGSGATVTATIATGAITGFTIVTPGSNYTSAPTLTIGNVVSTPLVLNSGGSGYTFAPQVIISGGGGTGAAATAAVNAAGVITGITLTNAGSNYTSAPTVTISNVLSSITVTAPGSGYLTPPGVTFASGSGIGSGGAATAVVNPNTGQVTGFIVTAGGAYTSAPAVTIASGAVTGFAGLSGGFGYGLPPTVTLSGGGATTQGTASAIVSNGVITGLSLVTGGTGYTSAPTVTITPASQVFLNLADTVNPSSLSFPGNNNYNINGSGGITGSGALTKSGSSTLVLGGNNTYSGGTTVSGGTLQLENPTNTTTTGPVLYMSFDNVSGSTVVNQGSGGSLMNGNLFGDAQIVPSGRYGNALYIPPGPVTQGYVFINNPVVLMNNNPQASGATPPGQWTVAMWIKTQQQGGNYFYQGNTGWSSGNTRLYTLGSFNDGTGPFAGGVRNSQSWETGQTPVTDNNWHFVAITTAPGNQKTLYVDGNVDSFSPTNNDNGWNNVATGNLVCIGGAPNASDANLGFNGLIDEVYMFNYALNQTQLQSLMTNANGLQGAPSLPVNGAVSLAANTTLDLNGNNEEVASLTGTGSVSNAIAGTTATLSVNNSTAAEFDGVISTNNRGALALNKTGNGALTLGGVNGFSGNTTVAGGQLVIGGTSGNGSITNSSTVVVGSLINSVAAVYQNGANSVVSNTSTGGGGFQIGGNLGAFGYYNLSAGAIHAAGEIDPGGSAGGIGLNSIPTFGQFDMSGGTVTFGSGTTSGFFLPNRGAAGSFAVVNVSGGVISAPPTIVASTINGLTANWGAGRQTAAITISGSGQFLTPSLYVHLNEAANSGNQGFLNLNGGVLQALGITNNGALGNTLVNFNGGTLLASNTTAFLSNFWVNNAVAGAYVYPGGATINDNGATIQIGQPLLAPSGFGVSSVAVSSAGSGYIVPPIIAFSGGGGSNATAYATINPNTGALTGVVVTSPGQGYLVAPTVTFTGGLGSSGVAAVPGAVVTAPNVSGGLTKIGSGRLVFTNINTYTGPTVISNGTLALSNTVAAGLAGSIAASSAIIVSNGATFDVSGLSANGGAGFTLASQNLMGGGTVNGAVSTSVGSSVYPGTDGGYGTLTFNNNLNMVSGATANFDLSSSANSGVGGGGVNDEVVVAGNLVAANNYIHIKGTGSLDSSADYVLFSVAGTISGAFNATPVFDSAANGSHYTIVTSSHTVTLHFVGNSNPLLSLGASATSVLNNQNVILTATVTPGTGTVTGVTLDESAIGQPSNVSMNNAGGNTYTATVSIPNTFAPGRYPFTAVVTDNASGSGAGAVEISLVLATGEKWSGASGASPNWSDNANWVGSAAPALSGDSLIFAGNGQAGSATMDQPYSIADLTFDNTAGSFTIGGGSTLTLSGFSVLNNSANAQTINVPVALNKSETINAAAGDITFGAPGGMTINGNQLTGTGSHNVNVTGGIIGTGAVTESGNGTLNISGQNSFTGPVTAQFGTVNMGTSAADSFSTNNTMTTLNGGTINVNGNISSANTTTVTGHGNFSLASGASIGYAAGKSLIIGTGTATLMGNVTFPTGGSASINVANVAGSNAVLNINGAVIANTSANDPTYQIGTGANSAGVINMTSGTVSGNSEFWIATADGQYGALNISGGTWTQAAYVAIARGGGWGVLNLSGGSISSGSGGTFTIGSFNGAENIVHAQATITGGLLTSANNTQCGEYTPAIVTVSGPGLITVNTSNPTNGNGFEMSVGGGPVDNPASIFNLGGATGGGTLETGRIYQGTGTAGGIFNFNGGTLRAEETTTLSPLGNNFFQNVNLCTIYGGGATVDVNSLTVTINEPLQAPAGYGVVSIPVVNGGSGYIANPVVQIIGGTGVGASALAVVNGSGQITGLVVESAGTGYSAADQLVVTLGGGGGSGAIIGTPVLALNNTNGGLTLQDSSLLPTTTGTVGTGANGSLALGGVSTYSGPTIIPANATLLLTNAGSINNSSNIIIASGGVFDVSHSFTASLGANQKLSGTGSINGVLGSTTGSAIYPGTDGTIGTLTFNSGLTMGSGATVNFDLAASTSPAASDSIVVNGPLTVGGNVFHIKALNGTTALSQTTDYVLLQGSPIVGAFASTPVFDGPAPSNAGNFYVQNVGNNVVLHYSAVPIPIGNGSATPNTGVLRNQTLAITVNIVSSGHPVATVAIGSVNLTPNGNNTVWTGNITIPPTATPGNQTLLAIMTDNQGTSGNLSIPITIVASTETWSGGGTDQNWDTNPNWAVESGHATPLAPGYVGDSFVFSGSTGLTPVMDNNYSTPSLTFSPTAGSFVIGASGANILTLTSPGLTNAAANTETLNVPISFTSSARAILAAPNGNFNLGGAVSDVGGGVAVTTAPTSSVTLAGQNTYQGNTVVSNGTLNLTGSISPALTSAIIVGNRANGSGVLNVTGGSITIPGGAGNVDPSFEMGIAAGSAGSTRVSGSAALSGPSELWCAVADGEYGALTVNGGSVTTGSWLALARGGGLGVMNVNGGSVSVGGANLTIGSFENVTSNDSTSVHGLVNLTGGSITTVGSVYVGEGETGVMNVTGGTVNAGTGVSVGLGNFDGNPLNCMLNLLGGTVTTPSLLGGAGTGTLNFNGGTVAASTGAATPFMNNVTAAYVYGGGVTIDDGGGQITIGQPLLAPGGYGVTSIPVTAGGTGYIDTPLVTITGGTGSNAFAVATLNYSTGVITGINIMNPGTGYLPGDVLTVALTGGGGTGATFGTPVLAANSSGGLTKLSSSGSGTTTLTAVSTYTNATTVTTGTLALSGNGSIANSSALNLAAGATFDVSALSGYTLAGNLVGSGTIVTGSGFLATGSHSQIYPGTDGTAGTLTVTGNLTLGGGATANFDLSGSSSSGNDAVSVSGTLTLSGNTLHIKGSTLSTSGDYVLFTAASVVGAFNTTPVFDGTAPANAANYSVVVSGNTVVLHFSQYTGVATVLPSSTAVHYQSITVQVTVNAGNHGTITSVVLNESALGGSSSVSLVNTSGNTWTTPSAIVIPANTPLGISILPATITDASSAVGNAYASVNVVTGDFLWSGAAGDVNWTDNANWTGGSQPGFADIAVFGPQSPNGFSPNMNGSYSLGGLLFTNGAPSYTIGGSGTMTLLGAGGGVTNNSLNPETISMPITLRQAPVFNAAAGNLVVNGLLTDSGSGVVGAGGGNSSVTLTANSTFVGPIVAQSGTLILTGNTLNPPTLAPTGGILEIGDPGSLGGGVYSTPIVLSGGGSFAYASSVPQVMASVISGNGSVIVNGPGNLTLGVDNTYTGGTVVNNGGQLILPTGLGGGIGVIVGTLTINPGGLVRSFNRDSLGYVAGTSVTNVTINGGTFNMDLDNLGFLADLNMTGGTLSASNSTVNGGNGAYFNITSGHQINTFATNATAVISSGVDIRGTSNLTINVAQGTVPNGVDLLISGIINNSQNTGTIGGIRKTGNGTAVFSGQNTYPGGTTNIAGILQAGAVDNGTSGPFGTGNISMAGGILQYSAANQNDYSARFANGAAGQAYNIDTAGQNVTFGSALTSSGGTLTKYGLGKLTLNAAATYSGATVISNGTLALGLSGSIAATGSLNIAAGGTLDVTAPGAFTLTRPLTANGTASAASIAGGAVNFGSQPITLNFDGSHPALTLPTGSLTLNGNTVTINTASPLGLGSYLVAQQATGSITSSGTLVLAGNAVGSGTLGTLVVSGGNLMLNISSLAAPTITFSTSGGLIHFAWPSADLGYTLQSNSINIADPTKWFAISGSPAVTNLDITINRSGSNTYFRLVSH